MARRPRRHRGRRRGGRRPGLLRRPRRHRAADRLPPAPGRARRDAAAALPDRRSRSSPARGGSSCSRTSSTTRTSARSSARPRRSASTRCSSRRGAPTRSTAGRSASPWARSSRCRGPGSTRGPAGWRAAARRRASRSPRWRSPTTRCRSTTSPPTRRSGSPSSSAPRATASSHGDGRRRRPHGAHPDGGRRRLAQRRRGQRRRDVGAARLTETGVSGRGGWTPGHGVRRCRARLPSAPPRRRAASRAAKLGLTENSAATTPRSRTAGGRMVWDIADANPSATWGGRLAHPPPAATMPRRPRPSLEVGRQAGLDEGGDRGAAEHRPDLAGRVVDAGARAGRRMGRLRVAVAASGAHMPALATPISAMGSEQLPDRAVRGHHPAQPEQRDRAAAASPKAVMSRGCTRSTSRPTTGDSAPASTAIGTSSSADWVGRQPADDLGVEHERERHRGDGEADGGDGDVGQREVAVPEQAERHERLGPDAALPAR